MPTEAQQERPAGRSFEDPRRPLGEELLERSEREAVADRAHAVAVLRKAEEFMRSDNPPANDIAGARRALQLAAGRSGVKIEEYDRIVRTDPEIADLQRRVIEEALQAPPRSLVGLPEQVRVRTW